MKSNKSAIRTYWTVVIIAVFLVVFPGCKGSLERVRLSGGTSLENLKPQAVRIIEQALDSTDPIVRANAIETVSATRQIQLMPKVQRLLGDDYVPVRFAAALAIGDTEYYLAKNILQRLIQVADENTKIAAAYALYKLGYKQYLEPIRQAATRQDQTVRANAVLLLGKTGDKSVLKILYWAKDADDSEPKVRYQAAEAIAVLGDEEILPKLRTMLVSKFVENKMIGIRAMGALGTAKAGDILFTKLDDDILEVRLATAEQLAALGDNSGEQVVLSVFEENLTAGLDEVGRERIMVLTSLAIGRLGTPKTIHYLPELIKDESVLVRLAAARAVLQVIRQTTANSKQ